MTIAVTSMTLALEWFDLIFPSVGKIIHLLRGGELSEYAVSIATEMSSLRNGLYPSIPTVLFAIWIAWRVSGRPRCEELDLKEVMGRLIGLVLFASAAAQYAAFK
jgi:hypothetical protein